MGAAPGTLSQVAATLVSKGSLARKPQMGSPGSPSSNGKDELRFGLLETTRKVEHDLLEDDSSTKTGLVYFQNSFKSKLLGASSRSSALKYQLNIYYTILSDNM